MNKKTRISLFLILISSLFLGGVAADEIATLRDGAPIDAEPTAGPIPEVVDDSIRPKRNYPMQPPLIPHDTDGFRVNLKRHKCMTCHSRGRTEDSQAPMIGVSHYVNREGDFLADVSPRNYFCNQCHVTQTVTGDVLENEFKDMDELLDERVASDSDD
jgi:cytochrome c-type protein NapB